MTRPATRPDHNGIARAAHTMPSHRITAPVPMAEWLGRDRPRGWLGRVLGRVL
jgi:hypothetical protein